MSLQTFVTLLVTGLIIGLIATLTGKSPRSHLALNLVIGAAGAFLGWFVLRQISGTAIMVGFAISGSVLLLGFINLIRK